MSIFKRCYLVEVGVLLEPDDREFNAYSEVYDKQHGYYDEAQYYVADKDIAINEISQYVQNGCDHTYGIVMETALPEDVNIDEAYVENENYVVDNIIYCLAKIGGKIVNDFIKK